MTEKHEAGASHIIDITHRVLISKIKRYVIPRYTFLQMDNCTPENKNGFVFAYLESTVTL